MVDTRQAVPRSGGEQIAPGKRYGLLLALIGLLAGSPAALGQGAQVKPPAPVRSASEVQGRKLLDEAKTKLRGIASLVVDYQLEGGPADGFTREGQITLARPSKFSVVRIQGMIAERRQMMGVSDGITVTRVDHRSFIAYRKPVRSEDFFLGQNFLVQFYFDPAPIGFDPTDQTWGQSVSLFDKNKAAYDKDVKVSYIGVRVLEGRSYQVVGVKYNTEHTDIRQQIYIGEDRLVYQVDTSFRGALFSQKFRGYRLAPQLSPEIFQLQKQAKLPVLDSDPLRLGKPAPDFTLPGYNGGELTLKELTKGRKGVFIGVLDGTAGRSDPPGPDALLRTMRTIQKIKDRFEGQGLVVVCIVGSPQLMPDLVSEMKLNWMPDVSRFNYPIVIDVDIERGIQGAAFENFKLNGRDSSLLDAQGRVVFASYGLTALNMQAFMHAMGQIGFVISPADIEAFSK